MRRRPRREWWSFTWVLKCSVRYVIRSVRSAICTSGDPVSWSWVRNLVTISDFLWLFRVMLTHGRRARLAMEAGGGRRDGLGSADLRPLGEDARGRGDAGAGP